MSTEDQPIFRDKNQAIGWEEAFDILHGQSQHQYPCSDLPPVKPIGEVFLFAATEASKRSKFADIS